MSEPRQLLGFFGLECFGVSLSGFPGSHLNFSVFNPFTYNAQISASSFSSNIFTAPHSNIKTSSFLNFLALHFFLQPPSAPIPLIPCSELAQVISQLPAHRWLQPGPEQWGRSCIPEAGRCRWGRCTSALPATAAVSTALQCHCAAGQWASSAPCSCQQALEQSAAEQRSKRLAYERVMLSNFAKKRRGPWYLHGLLQELLIDIDVGQLLAKELKVGWYQGGFCWQLLPSQQLGNR